MHPRGVGLAGKNLEARILIPTLPKMLRGDWAYAGGEVAGCLVSFSAGNNYLAPWFPKLLDKVSNFSSISYSSLNFSLSTE